MKRWPARQWFAKWSSGWGVSLSFVCILLASTVAEGRWPALRDPKYGVLDATSVVIVKPLGGDDFTVEESFLGTAEPGARIQLPGFKLIKQQFEGNDQIEPFTPATRILLFLCPKKATGQGWEITGHGECYFWGTDPARLNYLQTIARRGVTLRNSWDAARNVADVRQRVEALWPFLDPQKYGVDFLRRTEAELQKTGAVAGNFLAERFATMTYVQRRGLSDLDRYGSERLHAALREHLSAQRTRCENSLQASGFPLDSLPKNWPALPKEAKEAESEITYGLYSLAGFKDHSDLPFIRDLISWQVSHRLEYTYPNLLLVLGLMPDVKNLPLIAAMQHAIRAGDVVRALRDYRYPETLPLLARLLEGASPENSREALHYLKQIVGIDLGPNPQAWLDWYAQREKGHHD